MTDEVKLRINERKQVIIPKTWWSGEKKEVQRLELMDLKGELEEDERVFKINE